jgi:hypothetical protein
MKIEKNDLTDSTSLTYKLLQEMTDYVYYLRSRATRLEDLNIALVNRIRDGHITDTDDIDCARSWYEHSDLPVHKIMEKLEEEIE